MAIQRTVTGVNDGSELFPDNTNSNNANNNAASTILNSTTATSDVGNSQGFI